MKNLLTKIFSKFLLLFLLFSFVVMLGVFWPQIENRVFSVQQAVFEHDNIAIELQQKLQTVNSAQKQRMLLQDKYSKTSSLWSPIAKSELYLQIKMLDAKINALDNIIQKLQKEKAALQQIIDDSIPIKIKKYLQNNGLAILIWAVIVVIITPLLIPFITYFVFAKIVEVLATGKSVKEFDINHINISKADVKQNIKLQYNEKLYLRGRDGDWAKQRTNLKSHSKILWQWSAPFVSYVANLVELITLAPSDNRGGEVEIVAPMPDTFLVKIELKPEQELVIRPRYLVALTSGVRVKTRWNWRLHQLLSGRWRQIVIYGQGGVILAGGWGINVSKVEDNVANLVRMEENLLLGYVVNSEFKICRTETFWQYFRGRTPLFDYQLGRGIFILQNNPNILETNQAGKLESLGAGCLNIFSRLLGF